MHDESDCSSAEEERRNRQQHVAPTSAASAEPTSGKKQKNNQGLASPPPPLSCINLVQMQEMPYHMIPKMKSLSQLLEDAPHLTVSPFDGSPLCQDAKDKIVSGQSGKRKEPSPDAPAPVAAAAAAAAAMMFDANPRALASPGTEDLTKALAAARIAQQPDLEGHWVKTEFEKRLAALPRPEFFDPDNPVSSISQEQVEGELRRGRKVLPLQSVELESHLLAEAGTFVHKTNATKELFFPPCCKGEKCRGMTSRLRGQTRGCIFTMLLFDREYYYLINTGRPPPAEVQRPCVLCCRHDITEAVIFARQIRMQGETTRADVQSSVLPLKQFGAEIVQFYRNRMDCEGGYDRKHMLVTNHDPDDPILEPICMPGRSEIFCVESELLVHKGENGLPRIVIDQKKLLWKAPPKPVPAIGQNLLNFCGGAGNY